MSAQKTAAFAADCRADGFRRGRALSTSGDAASSRAMYQTEDMRNGWITPVAEPGRDPLRARVAQARTEPAAVQAQLREMEEGAMVDALVKIEDLVRAFEPKPKDPDFTPRPACWRRPYKVDG